MKTEWILCLGCRCRVPVYRGQPKPAHRTSEGRPCGYSGPMQYLHGRFDLYPLAQTRPQLRLVGGGRS